MYRITAVCTGNICRSPMAEYLIRGALESAGVDGVVVDSAGTSDGEAGNPVDPRAAAVLTRAGLDPSKHVARRFEAADFADADLVLALDTDHYARLRRLAPGPQDAAKVRLLRSFDPAVADKGPSGQGIYDPWYGDAADFALCHEMIRAALPGLVEHVRLEATGRRGA
ncbi:low molecular weight protein-tyrosine-phosphatase [Zafaria sp. Z1313]|uniref:low molecular weight protein-tyrosine-phosphatase n=1 Tax=unclassified Zafaria TaxID=2828765 RepID=UPI002E7847AF|nr:low molecular weight protein-tyrosine-phosphatase [Zafaria sp. J156]MEE1622326.1 low molecular weight protein-tyrosine-phosphatase [Zafaria sp. J156]